MGGVDWGKDPHLWVAVAAAEGAVETEDGGKGRPRHRRNQDRDHGFPLALVNRQGHPGRDRRPRSRPCCPPTLPSPHRLLR